jgi:hypothetical protein
MTQYYRNILKHKFSLKKKKKDKTSFLWQEIVNSLPDVGWQLYRNYQNTLVFTKELLNIS